VGHVDGNGEVRHRDVPVSSRFIVLADWAHSFGECIEAKAVDGVGAFGGLDCTLRVAGMGLCVGGDFGLGTGGKVAFGMRKHRTWNAER